MYLYNIMENRSIYIFRNYTVEPLFKNFTAVSYSGYEDVSNVPTDVSVYLWFYLSPANMSEDELIEKIGDLKEKLNLALKSCNQSSDILLFTLCPVDQFTYLVNKKRIKQAITEYNQYLYSVADSRALTRVIDTDEFLIENQTAVDWRYYFLYKTLLNPALYDSFSVWLKGKLSFIAGMRKKCIVLDLDDTLWGGVLGEEGLEGIKLGNDYPGNVYMEFQKMIFSAGKTGILLSIVSKNNEKEVWDAFEKHPDMILKKDDFVTWRINWKDKADNIRDIARELNIGLDSLVFIDDNPHERNWIIKALPEVIVPEFPESEYMIIPFFQDIYKKWFQVYDLTREDQEKLNLYKQNSKRQLSKKSYARIEDYIESLDTRISISEADNFSIPRIAQLTQKTNQFNLTTRRYSESDISEFLSSGHKVYYASVADKFGDNGITAVCIIKFITDEKAEIDTYLLSCRILGRFIESALLRKILNCLYDNGLREIFASYIPTPKNVQTATFYDKLGFEITEDEPVKKYRLKLRGYFDIERYYSFKDI